jgi:uncharacterized protein (DUF1810 family)
MVHSPKPDKAREAADRFCQNNLNNAVITAYSFMLSLNSEHTQIILSKTRRKPYTHTRSTPSIKRDDIQGGIQDMSSTRAKGDLSAFHLAQSGQRISRWHARMPSYEQARAQIYKGRKRGHWIWYIFPQIKGLGFSFMSRHFAIYDLDEAVKYLKDDKLRLRFAEITEGVKASAASDAEMLMGSQVDAEKLQASMTLFKKACEKMKTDADPTWVNAALELAPLLNAVLEKFFDGKNHVETVARLSA